MGRNLNQILPWATAPKPPKALRAQSRNPQPQTTQSEPTPETQTTNPKPHESKPNEPQKPHKP